MSNNIKKQLKIVHLLSSVDNSDESFMALLLAVYFQKEHKHVVEFVCWNKPGIEISHSADFKITYVSKANVPQYVRKNNYDIVINYYSSEKSHLEFLENLYLTISKPILLVDNKSYFFPLLAGYEYIIKIRPEFYKNVAAIVSTTRFTLSCYKEHDKLPHVVNIAPPCPKDSALIAKLNNKNILSIADWSKEESNLPGHVSAFALILKKLPHAKWHIILGSTPKITVLTLLDQHNIDRSSVFIHENITKLDDLFLNTSVYMYLPLIGGIPLAVLKAKIHGIPIVASKIAGLEDIIEHNINGYLAERNDDEEISEYVVSLLKNSSLRQKLGKSAHQRCKQFSLQNIGQKWDKLINLVLSKNNHYIETWSNEQYHEFQNNQNKIESKQEEYLIRCLIEKPTNKDNYILYFLLFSIHKNSNIQADYTEKNIVTKLLGIIPIVKYNVLIANNNVSKTLKILGVTVMNKIIKQ